MKHLHITIYGTVQGVYFRAATKAVADQLGVKGFIKNQLDGSVYIEAEGDDLSLEFFTEWCHQGPDDAQVQRVDIEEAVAKNFCNFEVLKRDHLKSAN